jgi:tetratricopeptide (TPR) repeat protein
MDASPTGRRRPHGVLLLGFLMSALACAGSSQRESSSEAATQPREIPAVEAWGDLDAPYGDAIEAAARQALGPPEPFVSQPYDEISLQDFLALDMSVRDAREARAREQRERAQELRRESNSDSLALYLDAIRTAPTDVPSYEEAGRILLQRGAPRRAHALVVQALRLDRQNALLWVYLAQSYQQLSDLDRAIAVLEHVQTLDKVWRAAPQFSTQRDMFYRADVQNVVEALAVLYVEKGELARAESLLTTADSNTAWLQALIHARRAREEGDLHAARIALEEATRHSDAQVAVFVELGSVLYALGDLDAAVSAYDAALRRAPHERAAQNGLGLVLWSRGDLDTAVAKFDALARSDPYDYAAQLNLGSAALELAGSRSAPAGSLCAQAEAAFSVCIEAQYHLESACVGRAQARLRQGDLDGAALDARAALDSPQHGANARLLLARAFLSSGRPEEVVVQLRPEFENGALGEQGLFILGKAYLDLDRAPEALPVLRQAYELQPEDWHVAMNYAVALSETRQWAEAEKILRRLAEEYPDNPSVLHNLAALLASTGRYSEADELLRRARDLRH